MGEVKRFEIVLVCPWSFVTFLLGKKCYVKDCHLCTPQAIVKDTDVKLRWRSWYVALLATEFIFKDKLDAIWGSDFLAPSLDILKAWNYVQCTVDREIFVVKNSLSTTFFWRKSITWNILCNVHQPILILVAKIWQRKLDYAKYLQTKYFIGENIPIYGI